MLGDCLIPGRQTVGGNVRAHRNAADAGRDDEVKDDDLQRRRATATGPRGRN